MNHLYSPPPNLPHQGGGIKENIMFESPLFWPAYIKEDVLYVLDETLVPSKLKYIPVKNVKGAVVVIREMKTRAFGQFLVVLNTFLLEIAAPLPNPPHRGEGINWDINPIREGIKEGNFLQAKNLSFGI